MESGFLARRSLGDSYECNYKIRCGNFEQILGRVRGWSQRNHWQRRDRQVAAARRCRLAGSRPAVRARIVALLDEHSKSFEGWVPGANAKDGYLLEWRNLSADYRSDWLGSVTTWWQDLDYSLACWCCFFICQVSCFCLNIDVVVRISFSGCCVRMRSDSLCPEVCYQNPPGDLISTGRKITLLRVAWTIPSPYVHVIGSKCGLLQTTLPRSVRVY